MIRMRDRPDAIEVEVTPEMIEVGTPALFRFNREMNDEADALREIFEAMWRAHRRLEL